MQQQIPKWRSVFKLTNSSSIFPSPSHSSLFHSTPVSLAKWKSKWKSDVDKGQQPSKIKWSKGCCIDGNDSEGGESKNYIRYATRQKRADAKKALRDLLFKKYPFQDVNPTMNAGSKYGWDAAQADNSDGSHEKSRRKNSSRKATPKYSSRSRKGKARMEDFDTKFDEQSETVFRATFGSRWYTRSFRSWDDSHFNSSSNGFEWRDQTNWRSNKRNWGSAKDSDADNEPSDIGSHSQRKILGLPLTGPIKIEDVKTAFRSSALMWHPDKHEGASQAMAEEKFKLCVDAYKSLCSALSA